MIVTCEKCNTSFELDDSLVEESGSEVKCSECQHVFMVQQPEAAEEPEAVLDLEDESPDLPDTEEELEEEFDIEALGLEEESEAEEPTLEAEEVAVEETSEAAEEKPDEEELELEGIGSTVEEAAEEKRFEDELDLEGISRAVEEAGEALEPVSEEATDEVLDFDLLDAEEKPVKDEVAFEEIGVAEERAAEEAAQAEAAAEKEPEPVAEKPEVKKEPKEEMPPPVSEGVAMPPRAAMKAPAGRKRISTPVIILVVLGLVAGGAYGGYVYLKRSGTSVPYLESITGAPETTSVDTGNLQIAILERMEEGFVDSTAAGRLFMIKGEVRNDYPSARNFIMVKGVLYGKDGKAVQQKNIYCGNVFPDSELQAVDKATIERRLRNKFGDERSNFQVPPGKTIPFMIVFSDLPQDYGEYSVEVVSSVPAQ